MTTGKGMEALRAALALRLGRATMPAMEAQRTPPQDLGEIARTIEAMGQQLRARSPSFEEVGRGLEAAAATLRDLTAPARDQVQDLGRPAVPRETRPVLSGKPASAQELDPHLAERLHQLRHRLGLSVQDMAQRLGLWGANGADNLRQMERCARPLPGTLQVLLGYLEREQDRKDFPPDVPYRSVLADLSDEERAAMGLPPAPKR